MHELAITLRAAQFHAHACHNYVSGPTFFSDHAYLGELYEAYEEAYDAVIERIIGDGSKPDLNGFAVAAAAKASAFPTRGTDAASMFRSVLQFEEMIRKGCEKYEVDASMGEENLLQQLADDSETRTYKLRQRLGL